jgi:energy-coupling factor transporter ATP-binding protein EcfA2
VFDVDRAANADAARTDLVARLLLMSADQDRVTWLHGSAVRIGDTAVAFVGKSGSGKSTLALALARNGAQHICDDALPIEHADPPVVWSSDGTIRLCDDTRMRFASRIRSVRRESDGKHVVTQSAVRPEGVMSDAGGVHGIAGIEDHCIESRAPLSALYLLTPLAPAKGTAESATTRRLLAPSTAVGLLIRHLKLGALVAPDYPSSKMKQLGEIVRTVPVFELRIPRDWSLLGDAVSQLVAWHNPAPIRLVVGETAGIEQ